MEYYAIDRAYRMCHDASEVGKKKAILRASQIHENGNLGRNSSIPKGI